MKQAFVEINDPFLAVGMRTEIPKRRGWSRHMLSVLGDALDAQRDIVPSKTLSVSRPRQSVNNTHGNVYFEATAERTTSNELADLIKARLRELGYELVERFEV